jgi:hypothetical protein
VKHRKAAIIGALTITAAASLQDFMQGDTPSVVKIGLWLFLGGLIGVGVGRFLNRKR